MIQFHCHGFYKDPHLLLALLLFCTQPCRAFNIDVRFPVVKEGKTSGSLFGLSVAFHKQAVGQEKYLLLVGAPKERAEPKVPANETGDMYACPISTDPTDCIRMNLVSSDLTGQDEVLDGMWLGVSVDSQKLPGGRVLACGHRYVRIMSSINWRMIGRCYIRSNDLSYDPGDFLWQSYYEVCNPNGNELREGMCTMGISAAITQSEVIVGSPGCYNWQGNADVIWRDTARLDSQNFNFPDMRRGNIYIGYSVAIEHGLLSREKETVVTGAPRDNAKGSVFLANIIQNEDQLKEKVIIEGEQVGSYFGNSIAVLDVNNDSWNDIIVGAPFYFDRMKEEGGAVYVFMNENGSFQKSAASSKMILKGPKNSGFGMAVAAIGDANQDGFQDLAVGAPYYGSGCVYIFTGSKTGILPKPSQVIEGKEIPGGNFQTFGYSIRGGVDVDENSYPDMVVGSLDDRVVLLRTRPVIHLKRNMTLTPQTIDPENCDSCVEATVCFSYTVSTGDSSFRETIEVNYTVKADVLHHGTHSRLHFLDNKDVYTGTVSMPSSQCQTLKLKLVKPIRDKVSPVVFSLTVSLLEPDTKPGPSLQNLNAFPVISEGEVLMENKEIHFQKACGSDNKCESNLQMAARVSDENMHPFPSEKGHQVMQFNTSIRKLILDVNVTNLPSEEKRAEDAHYTTLNVTVSPTLQFSGFRPKDSSIFCSPVNSAVVCELGNPFSSNRKAQIAILFETSMITLDTPQIDFDLQLSTLSEQSDLTPVHVILKVNYILDASFHLEHPRSQVYFSGKVIGQSAMKSTNDIGSPVEFTYKVSIQGKPLGSLGTLMVVFDWPYEVANGKWLLYLSEIQIMGASSHFCEPPGNVVNPLNLTVSERKISRRKRDEGSVEVEHTESQASFKTRGLHKQSVQLNCATGGARCHRFSCPLKNMTDSANVTVRARLWNSTMLEDFKDAWRVTVNGQAILTLTTTKATITMKNVPSEFILEIEPEFEEDAPYEAPLWIIIVSVLVGVLLLGLITLVLWKCGFFVQAGYFRVVPKYHGVKIGREEHYQINEGFFAEGSNKKQWMTIWTEM
ncbi:integrin alpha-3 [Chanos chanos]|uniref:Integrin alpha-3 n=1 Tax=Chanos chanos TaxID=29144 RepID=A0A6J2W423_CHACN|nr:integrin alpha-3-like [Chanos chanos]